MRPSRREPSMFSVPKRKGKLLGCIQIEVSSRCFLSCTMCPRTALAGEWMSSDMPLDVFRRISEHFHLAEVIYLSGWGEPLLNPNILRMARMAKRADCLVGFTTNGVLLDERTSQELIQLGLDVIGISIAGATRRTHNSIRVGSDLGRIMGNVKDLISLRRRAGSEEPKVIFLMLLLKQNIHELPAAVELAAEVGADGLVATNLSYAASQAQDDMRTFSCPGEECRTTGYIEEAEEVARDLGLAFKAYPQEMEEAVVCDEDPLNNIYISFDGRVAPCVYLNLPVEEFPRFFCGKKHLMKRFYFGDIREEDLPAVLEKKAYKDFRGSFLRRAAFLREALTFDLRALRDLRRILEENPLPDPCRTCYKAYGI